MNNSNCLLMSLISLSGGQIGGADCRSIGHFRSLFCAIGAATLFAPFDSISRSINKEDARVDGLLYDKIIVWSCYFTGIPFIENTVKKMRSDTENI